MEIVERLESEDDIESVSERDGRIFVDHDWSYGWGSMTNPEYHHGFTDTEIELLQSGDIIPSSTDGQTMIYKLAASERFEFTEP